MDTLTLLLMLVLMLTSMLVLLSMPTLDFSADADCYVDPRPNFFAGDIVVDVEVDVGVEADDADACNSTSALSMSER